MECGLGRLLCVLGGAICARLEFLAGNGIQQGCYIQTFLNALASKNSGCCRCLARSAVSVNFNGSEQCAEAAMVTMEFNGSSAGNLEDCEAAGRRGYVGADGTGSGLGAKSGGSGGMDLRLSASGEDQG